MDIEFRTDFFTRLNRLGIPSFNRRLLLRAGVEAVNFSKERFVQKNWLDSTREPWEPRKKRSRGSLMVKSGRLKRSIRKISDGHNFVLIGTDVPYAQLHNEGGTVDKISNVRSHSRSRKGRTFNVVAHRRKMNLTVPKRQFLGNSRILGRRIERQIARDIQEQIGRI